jgi:hypothetical protein
VLAQEGKVDLNKMFDFNLINSLVEAEVHKFAQGVINQ